MSITMYDASVPVFKRMLGNLDAILDKAKAYAEQRKIDPNALLLARLAPDMFHLIKQVQIASDMGKSTARLVGMDPPKFEDNEKTFEDLKARLAKTIAFLDTLKPEQFNGAETRDVKLMLGGKEFAFKGLDFLLRFLTPNVYFHVSAAYMILRHNGLDVGKRDFTG